jgi:hypothetical protein
MAVRDYREMYIKTILTLGRVEKAEKHELNRSYLAQLNFVELKELAQKLQG